MFDFEIINSFNQQSFYFFTFKISRGSRVIPIEKVNGKLGTFRYELKFYG